MNRNSSWDEIIAETSARPLPREETLFRAWMGRQGVFVSSVMDDFEIAPGADARPLVLEFTGVERVKIERETGDLLLKTAGVEVRQDKPVAYQAVGGGRREVASRYVLKGKRKVGIEVRAYDREKNLVIDSVLSGSTSSGAAAMTLALGSAN